jgi:hypothetical protein
MLTVGCQTLIPFSLNAGKQASLTSFKSAYFDLKKGLFDVFLGVLISDCALISALAIVLIDCDCDCVSIFLINN